jgi:hypothetical protein
VAGYLDLSPWVAGTFYRRGLPTTHTPVNLIRLADWDRRVPKGHDGGRVLVLVGRCADAEREPLTPSVNLKPCVVSKEGGCGYS